MTNREKFKEVFGFNPSDCVAPTSICIDRRMRCKDCPFHDWWDKEYKPCFEMREEGDQITNPESYVCECWEEKGESE